MHEGTAEYDITVYTIYGTIIYSCIHFSCIHEFSNSRPVMKGLWHLVLGALLDDACRDEESGIQTKNKERIRRNRDLLPKDEHKLFLKTNNSISRGIIS